MDGRRITLAPLVLLGTLLGGTAPATSGDDVAIVLTDVTKAAGLAGAGDRFSFADYDADGDPDLLIAGRRLLRNDTKGFGKKGAEIRLVDVTKESGIGAGPGGGACWVDLDRDGDLDVVTPHGAVKIQTEKGRFENRAAQWGLRLAKRPTTVGVGDVDGDGLPDVLFGGGENWNDGNAELFPRVLLRNVDGTRFAEVTEDHDLGGGKYGRAAVFADYDADGDLDLWVSNLVHKFAGTYEGRYDVRGWICDDSAIYRNDGAPAWRFTDVRAESGIPLKPTGDRDVFRGDELWSHAACADLDGDGLPEVFVTQVYKLPYSHSYLFRNLGGLRFEEISEAVAVRRFDSYGGAFADLDGDGDLDLVTNGRPTPEGDRELKLYRNDTTPGPWIAFRLTGPGGDPLPIGAQVVLETEDRRVLRQVDGVMGSHAQQNEGVLRFGLRGSAAKAAWVRWPGGLIQEIDELKTGRVHDVAWPKTKVPEIRLEEPEEDPEGGWRLRARAKRPSLAWVWKFDLDGDGTFETRSKDGTARLEVDGPVEVRVRLWRRSAGVGREAGWRLGHTE